MHGGAHIHYMVEDLYSVGKETELCSYLNSDWRLNIKNPNPGKFNSVYSAPASKQLEENIPGHIQMYDHKLQSESQTWSGQPTFPYLNPSHTLQSPFSQSLLKPPALFPPSPLFELTMLLQISLKNQKNRSISPRSYHTIKLPAQALTYCHPPSPARLHEMHMGHL